jgi:hypothetical protein
MSTPVEPATGSTMTAAIVCAPCFATISSRTVSELGAGIGLAAAEGVARRIVGVRKMVDGLKRLRGELFPVGLDAADGDSAEAHAVVAAEAADETRALRLTFGLPVGERDLEAVSTASSRVAEEDVVDVARKHAGQLLGELERQRMPHLERRERNP